MLPKGPLAKLAANPNATSIFNRSKALNKHIIKQPEWDIAADNMTLKSIQQGRNHEKLLQQQEQMRNDAKIKSKTNKKRIEEVRTMQQELRQKFIDINNFICECERKESIVTKKIAREEAKYDKLQHELNDIKQQYDEKVDYYENVLKPEIEELKVFDDVLQEIVDDSDLFTSKDDFLDRCEALLLVQEEVENCDEQNLKEYEDLQADIVKSSNEFAIMNAGVENETTNLQKQYDKSKAELLDWENVLPTANQHIIDQEKDTMMLLDQIQQLYLLFCERSGVEPKFGREQVEEQLDFIKMEIEITMDIHKMAYEMMALESRSDIAEYGSGKSGIPRK